MEKEEFVKEKSANTARPPIVVVMGHIDHGKTKILDWYRKTKVVDEESGGITQHIGAYEVLHKERKITFIDTPGHEAFSKLRSRGARVADIAILVIAADEGVKPQTKEAIRIIREENLPFVVALNKIDKPEVNSERVKQELAKEEVLVESYGGKIPSVEISAKQGTNMDELLEVILLLAEFENLSADHTKNAEGVVVEAHMDPKRGITSTLLILDGTLALRDTIVTGNSIESVKILEDFLGRTIEEAGPSSPVRVAGLTETPGVGNEFHAFPQRKEAEDYFASLPSKDHAPKPTATPRVEGRMTFNIVLKADVVGSKEALEDSLKKLETADIEIKIVKSEVGDINENDVKFAMSTKHVTIVGFKVKVDPSVRQLAESVNIHIITGEIIYDLINAVKKEAADIIPPEIKRIDLSRAKVIKIFRKDGSRQIVGGRVEEGVLKKSALIEIKRMRETAGRGNILQLQQNKRDVDEVEKGLEFGVAIDSKTEIKEGDILEVFEEEVIKRTL